jgi:hypothetical protein
MASFRPFDEDGYNFEESAKKLIEEIRNKSIVKMFF